MHTPITLEDLLRCLEVGGDILITQNLAIPPNVIIPQTCRIILQRTTPADMTTGPVSLDPEGFFTLESQDPGPFKTPKPRIPSSE